MYRKRLRPKYSDQELLLLYSYDHDHSLFEDHVLRVDMTLSVAQQFLNSKDRTAADLSCGDGYILDNLSFDHKYYGDFKYSEKLHFIGPIERTIEECPSVDVFICCETLEHLDDPDYILTKIRKKAKKLIISTPLSEMTDENPEHYWGWDKEAVKVMLKNSGWEPTIYKETLPPFGYIFQIWGCV